MRPWNNCPINDCGENLKPLPSSLYCIEPHLYSALGAPYGNGANPWQLREGVLIRLIKAQENLQKHHPKLRFAIFDAWRPVSVQAFMVEYSINEECKRLCLSRTNKTHALEVENVVEQVGRFWAKPSDDPQMPPPHSTGGAVDLTLADLNGKQLNMGGEIDEIGEISEPSYFSKDAEKSPSSVISLWDKRRRILANTMKNAGFVQHPNEWWHFSYGDQLWALFVDSPEAIYGSYIVSDNNSITV